MTTQDTNSLPRLFRTGTTVITEDASTRGLNVEEVRAILKRTYPELEHATYTTDTDEQGQTVITFMPKPGRKG